MAADPRQFTEHNEIGGVTVYLEDKRMSELKSATGKTASQISTADEYIPLQDTDGNLVKINPASFQEAVRNVLGSLLANNDKGTTISGIPALSGSGASLDFGSVTPANLASVLGGRKALVKYIGITATTSVSGNASYVFDSDTFVLCASVANFSDKIVIPYHTNIQTFLPNGAKQWYFRVLNNDGSLFESTEVKLDVLYLDL